MDNDNPYANRRFFLKASLAAGAAMVVGDRLGTALAGEVNKNSGKLLVEAAKNPLVMDFVLDNGGKFLQLVSKEYAKEMYDCRLEPNPNQKPLYALISKEVEEYGEGAYFTERPYKSKSKDMWMKLEEVGLLDKVRSLTLDDLRSIAMGDPKYDQLLSDLKKEAGDVIVPIMGNDLLFRAQNIHGIVEIIVYDEMSPLSRYANTVLNSKRDAIGQGQALSPEMESEANKQTEPDVSKKVTDIIDRWMLLKPENDKLSTSKLFRMLLDDYQGDISGAIIDTGLILKLLARNDLTDFSYLPHAPERYKELCARFKDVKDEFLPLGENFGRERIMAAGLGEDCPENKDFSLINLIGSPYHAWEIAGMLSSAPSDLLTYVIVGQMMYEMRNSQRQLKTAADVSVLKNLDTIEKFLKIYIKPNDEGRG